MSLHLMVITIEEILPLLVVYCGYVLNAKLNNVPAFSKPPCFRIMLPGEYCYIRKRNNNFSTRHHVRKIIVTQGNALPKLDRLRWPGKILKHSHRTIFPFVESQTTTDTFSSTGTMEAVPVMPGG